MWTNHGNERMKRKSEIAQVHCNLHHKSGWWKWQCKVFQFSIEKKKKTILKLKNFHKKSDHFHFQCEQNVGCGQLPWIRIFIPISHWAWLHYASFNVWRWLCARTKWIIVQGGQCFRKFQKDFTSILFRSYTFAACYAARWPMRIDYKSGKKIRKSKLFPQIEKQKHSKKNDAESKILL